MTDLTSATALLSTAPSLSITHLLSSHDTPTDLAANLSHHRDLFTKLRFSYTEQVTKERLLKAAASDPPDFVAAGELAALEAKLVHDKAALKGKKRDVETMLGVLGERGRRVAVTWQEQEQEQEGRRRRRREGVRGVQRSIPELEARKKELLARRSERDVDPLMRMGLEETREVCRERKGQGEVLARRVEEVRTELERRREEVERMKREMQGLEERKRTVVREAVEMRRRRGSGEVVVMDEVEAKGRWNRAAEGVLRALC